MQLRTTPIAPYSGTTPASVRPIATPGFTAFRGRTCPEPGLPVRVYRNLNRPGLYSMVALSGPYKGKVVGYAPAVALGHHLQGSGKDPPDRSGDQDTVHSCLRRR